MMRLICQDGNEIISWRRWNKGCTSELKFQLDYCLWAGVFSWLEASGTIRISFYWTYNTKRGLAVSTIETVQSKDKHVNDTMMLRQPSACSSHTVQISHDILCSSRHQYEAGHIAWSRNRSKCHEGAQMRCRIWYQFFTDFWINEIIWSFIAPSPPLRTAQHSRLEQVSTGGNRNRVPKWKTSIISSVCSDWNNQLILIWRLSFARKTSPRQFLNKGLTSS